MTRQPNDAVVNRAGVEAGDKQNAAAHAAKFVINLCLVSAPIRVPQPRSPQLARFRFFFSPCPEEGRRQHRLIMGYFSTVSEAQKWLQMLVRAYPHAFVSEAPAAQPDLLSDSQIRSILGLQRL
jgi:hypothetical protein